MIFLGATVIMSLIAFSNEELKRKWTLNPYLVHHRNQWWRMLTSGFIHADFMHLFFNLFAFYGFGMAVEKLLQCDF
jgi:membrane associated rhomboid family serine protease